MRWQGPLIQIYPEFPRQFLTYSPVFVLCHALGQLSEIHCFNTSFGRGGTRANLTRMPQTRSQMRKS